MTTDPTPTPETDALDKEYHLGRELYSDIAALETRLRQSEASREEMRAELQNAHEIITTVQMFKDVDYDADKVHDILTSTSNPGWLSPDEVAKLREDLDKAVECANMHNQDFQRTLEIAKNKEQELTTLRARVAKLEGAIQKIRSRLQRSDNYEAIISDALELAEEVLAPPPPSQQEERTYPCDKCGVLRSKAEGGTTFTVCDECWDRLHTKPTLNPEGSHE